MCAFVVDDSVGDVCIAGGPGLRLGGYQWRVFGRMEEDGRGRVM